MHGATVVTSIIEQIRVLSFLYDVNTMKLCTYRNKCSENEQNLKQATLATPQNYRVKSSRETLRKN